MAEVWIKNHVTGLCDSIFLIKEFLHDYAGLDAFL